MRTEEGHLLLCPEPQDFRMHLPQAIRYQLNARSRRGLSGMLRKRAHTFWPFSLGRPAGLQKMDKEPIDLRDRAAELAPLTRSRASGIPTRVFRGQCICLQPGHKLQLRFSRVVFHPDVAPASLALLHCACGGDGGPWSGSSGQGMCRESLEVHSPDHPGMLALCRGRSALHCRERSP